MRGFYNTLNILKGEFLQTLQQFDLLERFFSFLVSAIDQPILRGEDMVSANLLESKADLIRNKVMNNYDICFKEQKIDRKICFEATGTEVLHTCYTEKK